MEMLKQSGVNTLTTSCKVNDRWSPPLAQDKWQIEEGILTNTVILIIDVNWTLIKITKLLLLLIIIYKITSCLYLLCAHCHSCLFSSFCSASKCK